MAAAYDDGVSLGPTDTRELDFLIRGLANIDVDEELGVELDQPRIYYGDGFDGYAIVGNDRAEVDFPTDTGSQFYRYDGNGGVPHGFPSCARWRSPCGSVRSIR